MADPPKRDSFLQLAFTEENWACVQNNWKRWWASDLSRPLVMIEFEERNDGSLPPKLICSLPEDIRFSAILNSDLVAAEILEIYWRRLCRFRWFGDAWPRWYPYFGPGIVAGFLGSNVNPGLDTIWFSHAAPQNVLNSELSIDWLNPWWLKVKELTELAVHKWGDHICIGYTDLGGILDILASLRGTEQLLIDLYDNPDYVRRALDRITVCWMSYYNELHKIIQKSPRGTTSWANLWASGSSYILQCDFAYMISPKHFELFALPDIEACCEQIEYPFYHLDGKGQIPHLEMLLAIKKLKGIQWIPGEGSAPPEKWLSLLSRIRNKGKLCQLYVTAKGAKTIVSNLGGKGFAFSITDINNQNDAKAFLESLLSD